MKLKVNIIIENDLAGIEFKKGNKQIEWNLLTKKEQESILRSMSQHYNLFFKFLKDE